MIINSKSNEKVKFVKSLNDKKFRNKNNAYYLEGIKVINEVVFSNNISDINFIFYSKEILSKVNNGILLLEEIIKRCEEQHIPMYEVEKNILEYVCDTVTPQGILCVLNKKDKNLISEIKNVQNENIFILDGVQDMGNLGTIIRNAAAFNIDSIICLENTADIYSPKVLRSTMGNIFKVNIFYEKFEEVLKILKENNYTLVGTSLNETKKIDELDFNKKIAFVFGNEANGVTDNVLSSCDEKIKIEMNEQVESLNVSVASGIVGYIQYKNKFLN